ncbi:MAG: hypothetical protein HC795_00415 [Coleofasciculaceae cyanobacterium RL_1_1]|nr:hypothetical protein [Coleofasciculaceae cyanobacterium RL_1_1]
MAVWGFNAIDLKNRKVKRRFRQLPATVSELVRHYKGSDRPIWHIASKASLRRVSLCQCQADQARLINANPCTPIIPALNLMSTHDFLMLALLLSPGLLLSALIIGAFSIGG